MKTLTEKDVEFTIECLPEEIPVKGNASASGDDDLDRETEQWIYEQLNSGNEWAWCTIKVTAAWGSYKGVDYLGCCSYKSQADFMTPDGDYPQMKEEALDRLNESLLAADTELSALR